MLHYLISFLGHAKYIYINYIWAIWSQSLAISSLTPGHIIFKSGPNNLAISSVYHWNLISATLVKIHQLFTLLRLVNLDGVTAGVIQNFVFKSALSRLSFFTSLPKNVNNNYMCFHAAGFIQIIKCKICQTFLVKFIAHLCIQWLHTHTQILRYCW